MRWWKRACPTRSEAQTAHLRFSAGARGISANERRITRLEMVARTVPQIRPRSEILNCAKDGLFCRPDLRNCPAASLAIGYSIAVPSVSSVW
jgi:hypothetical protein